jgi:hypothetical protein
LEASTICGFKRDIGGNVIEEEAVFAIAILRRSRKDRLSAIAAGCIEIDWAHLSCLHVLSIRDTAVASSLEGSIEWLAIALRSIDGQGWESEIVESSRIASAILRAILLGGRTIASFNSRLTIYLGTFGLELNAKDLPANTALASLEPK